MQAHTVAYPKDRVLGLDALVELAAAARPCGPHVIVAESFSGPIALRLAATDPSHLTALVLVATFVTSPFGGLLRWSLRLGASLCAHAPTPRRLIARQLLGDDRELVPAVQACVGSLHPAVLASRLRMLADIDAKADLEKCAVPILYLAGAYDRLVTSEHGQAIARHDRVTLEVLPGPHLLLQTQPHLAAWAIESFLARVALPTT
jgi:pimeloyl-ACP methyl ester carboxylesterase